MGLNGLIKVLAGLHSFLENLGENLFPLLSQLLQDAHISQLMRNYSQQYCTSLIIFCSSISFHLSQERFYLGLVIRWAYLNNLK